MKLARTGGGLRTRIYVDGYNLYYGCLKGTVNKWLDVHSLVEGILPSIKFDHSGSPASYCLTEPAVKYFTASILESFSRSADAVDCQKHYHSALLGHLGSRIQIVKGYYDARPARAHLWEEGKAARECEKVEVWKLEEKQSDVALALHAFSDAVRGEIDQIVVITNDSDFAPAMQLIREQTNAVMGLISPIRPMPGNVNAQLEKNAHWVRRHILDEEIAKSQLPQAVRNGSQVIHKPLSWYPRPDLLAPIFDEAKRVKRSRGSALKWLNQPCERLGGRVPIKMAENEAEAEELLRYMTNYAREFGV